MGKISRKFNWLLILSVSLSVFISTIATTSYLIHISEKNTHDKNIIQITGLSNYIDEYLNNAYTLNYQLSLNPIIINQLKSSNNDWDKRVLEYNLEYKTNSKLGDYTGPEFLVKIHKEYNFIDLLYIQDKNGDQTGKSYGQLGHRKERWWFKEFMGIRDLNPFISKSYYSLTGNKPVASIFHPVMDEENFLGIIGMDIVFSDFQKSVETYLNTNDMYAIVLDPMGVIIAHPDKSILKEMYNLKTLTKQVLKRNNQNEIILDSEGNHLIETVSLDWGLQIAQVTREALEGKGGYLKNSIISGIASTIYYEPVSLPSDRAGVENYAVLLIQGKTAIVEAKVIIIVSTVLLIIFTIVLLFTIFHFRFQKFIIEPLEVLIESMNNVDIDNFQIIELHTDDEFSLMADTYNDLRKNLSLANRQLLEKIETLKEREAGFKTLSEIGLALSTENNIDNLLELVLMEAMRITRSDGGTLYIHDVDNRQLRFELLCNETMDIKLGGTSENKITFPPVPLYNDGKPNFSNVSSYSALTGEVVNIPDVYQAEGFDFSGMRSYDKNNGYHSESMLVIPMMNKDKELIGVLQLINAQKKEAREIIPYSKVYENLIATLAYQSAVKMTNVQLHLKLKELLYSIIKSIAKAIDEKSPFTGKHISHVFYLTMIIANKINQKSEGYFKDIHFSDNEMEELKLAAWMHDIGKITTPESLLNKGTKLKLLRDG
ncbi:MAG: GAF domain-containing protein, partial [Spirochaetales bacterium]|nr:GAF domain-containing protein [Spirochaetales bacterium]